MMVNQPSVPPLGGMRKDHKTGYDPVKGPPNRPWVPANDAPNAPLSNFCARFLKGLGNELAESYGTEATNTEELCRTCQDDNKTSTTYNGTNQPDPEQVLGSMDVKALYPSITKEMARNTVEMVVAPTNLNIQGVDDQVLTRYVALAVDRSRVTKAGVEQYIPVPESRTTLNSYIKVNKDKQFRPGSSNLIPDQSTRNKILGLAIGEMVHQCMDNHYFKFGEHVYRQRDGGAIGSDLTGEIARLFMLLWDRIFLKKIEACGILRGVYKRYVDDILMALRKIRRGVKYCPVSNSLVPCDPSASSETNPEDDKYTFNILKEIANTIEPNIQMEVDIPSNHQDKMLPVLDLKMYINKDNQISHRFYSKDIASPFTILERSAVSMSTKRNTIFQEIIRRIRNTSPDHPWTTTAWTLTEYMNKLQISGYNHRFRYNVLKGAIDRSETMERKYKEGVLNRYRSRSEINKIKAERQGRNPNTWFIGDQGMYSSTLVIPHTPNSTLAREIKSTTKDRVIAGGHTKVIEATGHPVTVGLQKRDPFRKPECPYIKACQTDNNTDCTSMNVTYRLDCQHCPEENQNRSVYIGCTGKSLHNRVGEHMAKISGKTKKVDNAMAKHMAIHHKDIPKGDREVKATIVAKHNSTLGRFVDEAVRLTSVGNLANSKGEWGCGGLVRLIPSRNDKTITYSNTDNQVNIDKT